MRAAILGFIFIQSCLAFFCSGFHLPPTTIGGRTGRSTFETTNNHGTRDTQHGPSASNHGPRQLQRQRQRLFVSTSPPSPDNPESDQLSRRYLTEEEVRELLSGGLSIGKGQPSYPAWRSKRRRKKLFEMTEWATSDEPNRPILCEYEPDALWLWTRWRGTVLSMTYIPIAFNVAIGIFVNWYVHSHTEATWSYFAVPPQDEPLIQELAGLKTLWEYQLTLCTFILAFFTGQAYTYWRQVYFTTRAIQGRINDICLIITTNAERESQTLMDGSTVTVYSERAAALVDTCTRLIRVSHTFFWAAMPTNSNGVSDKGWEGKTFRVKMANGDGIGGDIDEDGNNTAIGPVLLSPTGLRFMERAEELTHAEVMTLLDSHLPPSQYTYMLMQWVAIYATEGFRDGTLVGGDGAERELMRRVTDLRAEYFSIGDLCAGRMPIAYVQLIQILVDILVWLAPFSLFPGLGSLSIFLCAVLTHFFKGLLELSKSFLDPFGNDGYPNQNIRVDVLVSELNFGAASRWKCAAQRVPTPPRTESSSQKQPTPKNSGSDADGSNNFHPL
mmetsp:Transcript_23752/g.55918  ORF Transcript_23752/g.55918 Transcript_23752/m.55918 type:complete len:556 (-) Transcript_23752:59-1726(-)